MISHPFLLVAVLLLIEFIVLGLSRHPRTQKWFDFLPPVFWIYFLPMLAATFGLVDAKSPTLSWITTNLLPVSLVLLLIPVDLRAIFRLGPQALFMFFIGSVGIILGTVLMFLLVKSQVGIDFWAGFGALSASWTGGSANMIAVKEALSVPDRVFTPMVIVDTVVPYMWMGLLIAGAGLQNLYDRWNKSDRRVMDDLADRIGETQGKKVVRFSWWATASAVGIALVIAVLAKSIASHLPEIKNVISPYAWTIIVVSVAGLSLSLTPIRRIEQAGASQVGYWILYFVLTAIGAKASVANLGAAVVLITAGIGIVMIHASVLLIASRWLKAPLFLVATASQANIGGVASAPVVAAVYQPELASVGLLLAILGNIVGTYYGILCGQLCRLVGG